MKPLWKKFRHVLATSFCVLCLLLCGCSASAKTADSYVKNDQKLVVYTSHKEEVYEPIIREFEERTGIWVDVHAGGTSEIMDAVRNGEKCDVLFGGGVETYGAVADLLDPYTPSQEDQLDDTYASPYHLYTVFSSLPIVFIVNDRLVSQEEEPQSWADLFHEEWRGRTAFASVHQSGTSYTLLAFMCQTLDLSPQELMEKLKVQLEGELSDGSAGVIRDVISGRKQVGITLEETAEKRIEEGAPLRMIWPQEGTASVPDGSAVIKGCANLDNARKFIDFTVSADVQKLLMRSMHRRSVRTDLPSEDERTFPEFDLDWSEEHRQEVMETWDAMMEE